MMSNSDDPFDLDRFVKAQESDYDRALQEIKNGRKRTHWIWYIFPQFDGLGKSWNSQHYAIKSRDEAQSYLRHPILGARLIESTEAVLNIEGKSAFEIFDSPDDMKLKSCATLFDAVSPPGSIFDRLLEKYFEGERDPSTLKLI